MFKVTARDQGHFKGPSGAFVKYCNISCFFFFFFFYFAVVVLFCRTNFNPVKIIIILVFFLNKIVWFYYAKLCKNADSTANNVNFD